MILIVTIAEITTFFFIGIIIILFALAIKGKKKKEIKGFVISSHLMQSGNDALYEVMLRTESGDKKILVGNIGASLCIDLFVILQKKVYECAYYEMPFSSLQ